MAAVSGFIASCNGWILEANHHSDQESQWFFMRHELLASSLSFDAQELRRRFEPVARQFDMTWQVTDTEVKKRVVLMVSKQDHCLSDLMHRWRTHELEMDLCCVISNHNDLRGFVEWHGVPYHLVPVTPETKPAAFAKVNEILKQHRPDAIVLARYMQVLPPDMCETYAGRVINIHHGFLPSFAGAKAYHQAFERGVKLIGATCHYVTAELDAGPIIEQDVIRVDHSDTVEDLARLGRDVEKAVLARGLRYHVQDRVLMHKNKTIVFP